MPSFLILTLGCKLNQLESEAITDTFLQFGFTEEKNAANRTAKAQKEEKGRHGPPVIVVNTCTVTSKADQKARRVIRKALGDYPESRIIVTGCYAQLNKDEILKLETDGKGRLLVAQKDKIINIIQSMTLRADSSPYSMFSNSIDSGSPHFQFNPQRFSRHTRSILKIQDGCDKQCTYCRIRLARGHGVSLEKEEVLSRLRILEQNHAEAVLAGVNISQYKDKILSANDANEEIKTINLAQLLDYLLSGTNKIALRLSSLDPESVDDDLCMVLSHPRIRPHFHLSVQSCSSAVLKKMGRSYSSEAVKRAVSLLRKAKDDPFLACDIIAGFPSETEIEFEETFNLCKELDFAWIHVFPYSKRPGTAAFSFTDTVHENEVTRRVRLFSNLAKQGRADYVRRWLGREVDVLIERREQSTSEAVNAMNKEQGVFGTSPNYLKALVLRNGTAKAMGDISAHCFSCAQGTVLRCRLIEENLARSAQEDFDVKAICLFQV